MSAGQLELIFYVCKPVGTAYSNGASKEGKATDGQTMKLSVSLTSSLVWCVTVTWIFRCDRWIKRFDDPSSLTNAEHQPDALKMHSQVKGILIRLNRKAMLQDLGKNAHLSNLWRRKRFKKILSHPNPYQ
jgi:hypothetical protein